MNLYLEVLHRYVASVKGGIFALASQVGEMVKGLLYIFENPHTTYLISLSTLLVLLAVVFFMEQKGY